MRRGLTYIGIDPAFREKGFSICIVDTDGEVAFRQFKSPLCFFDWLWDAPHDPFFVVENSNLQDVSFTFDDTYKEAKRLITSFVLNLKSMRTKKGFNYALNELLKSVNSVFAIECKRNRSVGKNQATSQFVVDLIRKMYGDHCLMDISPKEKGGKVESDNICKAMARRFKLVMPPPRKRAKNYTQDDRDAFLLAFIAIEKHQKIDRIKAMQK